MFFLVSHLKSPSLITETEYQCLSIESIAPWLKYPVSGLVAGGGAGAFTHDACAWTGPRACTWTGSRACMWRKHGQERARMMQTGLQACTWHKQGREHVRNTHGDASAHATLAVMLAWVGGVRMHWPATHVAQWPIGHGTVVGRRPQVGDPWLKALVFPSTDLTWAYFINVRLKSI